MSSLGGYLPQNFDFYHLGQVARLPADTATQDLEMNEVKAAIGFQISGDWQGLLLLAFDASLDTSIYSELGNIIASRWVSEVVRDLGIDVAISSPQPIARPTLQSILSTGKPELVAQYVHQGDNYAVPLSLILYAKERGRDV